MLGAEFACSLYSADFGFDEMLLSGLTHGRASLILSRTECLVTPLKQTRLLPGPGAGNGKLGRCQCGLLVEGRGGGGGGGGEPVRPGRAPGRSRVLARGSCQWPPDARHGGLGKLGPARGRGRAWHEGRCQAQRPGTRPDWPGPRPRGPIPMRNSTRHTSEVLCTVLSEPPAGPLGDGSRVCMHGGSGEGR